MSRLTRVSGLFFTSLLLSVLASKAADGPGTGKMVDKGIALSNSFAGNSWRQLMLQTWESASKTEIGDGTIKAAKAVNAIWANGSPSSATTERASRPS